MLGTYKSWEMPNTRPRAKRNNWKDHYPRGYVTKEMMWDRSDAEAPPRMGVQELMRQRSHQNMQIIERGGLPAHAHTHGLTGIDAIKLDDLYTPDDNTDLNATTSYHGLLRKLDGDTKTFLNSNGAWAKPLNTVKITSDINTSSETLGNATGLSFSVTSGQYYYFRFVLLVQSDNTNVGLQYATTHPSVTAYGARVSHMATSGATDIGATHEHQGYLTAADAQCSASTTSEADTSLISVVEGIIIPSADGTLQLQYAVESGAGSGTVTIKQGSMGWLYDYT